MPRRRQPDTAEHTPASLAQMINNQMGPGTLQPASEAHLEIERIPTGVLSIDMLLNGGVARGRHTEIYGNFSVGKTYLAMKVMAAAQQAGLGVAFVDCERTFDPLFAEHVGLDTDRVSYHRQVHGQMAVNIMETLLRSGLHGVIVLDSIAAILPMVELENPMEAGSMGTEQARLMSKALRRLTTANSDTALIYINQTREAVGTVFGNRAVTSGGKAMGFYAGTRLELVRTENIKKKSQVMQPNGETRNVDVTTGHRVLARVAKDKTGNRPYASTTFVFDYAIGGADPVEDLIYLGLERGLVRKSGTSWLVVGYEDERQVGRGRFAKWLRRNVAVADELEDSIRSYEEETQEAADEDE